MVPDLRTDLRLLEPFLDNQCQSWRRCSRAEHAELLRSWYGVYPSDLMAYARVKQGTRAFAEQESLSCDHFFLVQTRDPRTEHRAHGDIAYELWADRIPDFTDLSHHFDFFVSPPDMSWTVIYTHEVDLFGGPVFARAEWIVPPASQARHERWMRRHEREPLWRRRKL